MWELMWFVCVDFGLVKLMVEICVDNMVVICMNVCMGYKVIGMLEEYFLDYENVWYDVLLLEKFL